MKFRALVLNELPAFKAAFAAINWIMEEIELQVDSEGMRLAALDKSHITYSYLNLSPKFFDEFYCEDPLKLVVDTEELYNVLKRATAGDEVTLESDGENLSVIYSKTDFEYGLSKRRFNIRLIDEDNNHSTPKAPDFVYAAKFKVKSSWFDELLKDAEIVNDKLTLTCTSDGRFRTSVTGDYGDSDSDISLPEVDKLPGSDVSSTFNLGRLKDIMKAVKFDDTLVVELDEDVPLLVTFEKRDGYEVIGEVKFLLAPRIEKED